MERMCVLDENKRCDECGECSRCDLDPEKICDNCMLCLNTGAEYKAIEIDEIVESDFGRAEYQRVRRMLAEQDSNAPDELERPSQE